MTRKVEAKTTQDELVEALLGEAFVEDASPKDKTLQEHDRQHHPGGYHEGDTCKFRDKVKTETESDKVDELSNKTSSRKDLDTIAKKLKSFIKGVSIRFSDKPHEMDSSNTRKSIRQREQDNWNRILDAFEHKTAGADATRHHTLLEHTPAVLRRLGVPDLPITVMGGVIHKMIGNIRNSLYDYHEIPISELRNLLLDLDNPVAVFDSTAEQNAIVILTNLLDKHGNAKSVVPLKLDREASGTARENTIASAYGQKPDNLQRWIDEGYLRYVSKKGLKKSAQRLQLPRDSILKTHGVLMEEDFSAEQLGEIIPDTPSGVKGEDEKKEESGEVISFRDNNGEVVGTYNRKTNEVVLYEGADADTIGHELCGHATWQYAEQMARNGNDSLLKKMNEVVDSPTAKPVWDEVKANYEEEDKEVQREEVWAHIIGHKTSKAIEEINKSRGGRRWYQRFWGVVKEAWRGLVSAAGLNDVDTSFIDQMSPDEFSDFMVKQMTSGKTLGSINKGDEREEGGERKSIVKKPIVSAAEDAAYMAAVEKGDMETAANMVERIASIKFNTGNPLFHAGKLGSKGSNSYVIDAGLEGFHLGTLESATDRFLEVISELDDFGTIDSRATKQPNGQYRGEFVNETGKVLLETSKTYPNEHDAEWAVNVLLANTMKDENEAKKIIDGTGKFKLHKLVLRKDLRLKEDVDAAETDNPSWEKKIEEAKKEGYDGIVYKNAIEGKGTQSFVVWKGESVKSLDPVTYDNNGNVIPLSKRFDDGDDIRGDVSGNIEMLKTLLSKRHPEMDSKKLVETLAGLGSREEMEKEIKRMLGDS